MNSKKCCYIALIGAPNAGKSTLLNQLIGYKISIVSPKVQTTRNVINGIYTENDTQLIFVDTPGIFNPQKKLEKSMVKAAWNDLENMNFIGVLVDSRKGICANTSLIVERLIDKKLKNIVLILNKIDLIEQNKLQHIVKEAEELGIFSKTFLISALNGTGLFELKQFFMNNAAQANWNYSEDDITNVPIRFIACEFTREQLFLNLHEEIPYNVTVETEKWEELNNGSVKIHQVIYVSRDSQKKIILGEKGQMIKRIGLQARLQIENLLERPVHLFLFVKVKEDWLDNPDYYLSTN